MKTRFVLMGGILLVLMTLTFLVPIDAVRAKMETKACPGWICVITSASPGGSEHFLNKVMCRPGTGDCNQICCQDICVGAEKVIGQPCSPCRETGQYLLYCEAK